MNTIIVKLASGVALLLTGTAFAGPGVIAVPEPATLSLLAGGVSILAAIRYWHRN
jgi:hypothetical protein